MDHLAVEARWILIVDVNRNEAVRKNGIQQHRYNLNFFFIFFFYTTYIESLRLEPERTNKNEKKIMK